MYLKAVSLRSMRNYGRLDLELGPGINLFYGENAKGKTNLLEAVCYLGSLRSFRGAKGADMLTWGEKSGTISGLVARTGSRHKGAGGGENPVGVSIRSNGGRGAGGGETGEDKAGDPARNRAEGAEGAEESGRNEQGRSGDAGMSSWLAVSIADGKRRVTVDGKRPDSAAAYLSAFKVASFSPEDLFLVKEYPSHRRRFLDRSIFHLYPGYLELANRYRNALGQLNAALKSGDSGVVAAWEEVIGPLAAGICFRRREQAALIGGLAAGIYKDVLGGGELEAAYRPSVEGDTVEGLADAYRERLAARRADGLKRGHCTVGPHTEDMQLTLSGRDMRLAASRGQSRLALLALVLADCRLYRRERGLFPALLLDDAASELDSARKKALMEYISGMGQALLTSTCREIASSGGLVFRVEGNTVKADGAS